MAYTEGLNLVTGACGFAGTHMVKLLLESGKQVRATDRAQAREHPKWRSIARKLGVDFEAQGVEFVPADLTERESLSSALRGVDCLFHTASLYDYSAPMEALERVNIHGTTNLLEEMVAQNVSRVVHWSTCGVYGKPIMPHEAGWPGLALWQFIQGILVRPFQYGRPFQRPGPHPTNVPFTEDRSNPLNTPGDQPLGTHLVNDYSVTKWKQEQLVQRYMKEHGLKVTVIRPAPLYGPGSDYGVGGLAVAMSEGLLPAVPSDMWNFIMVSCHVRDICKAALFVADREDTLGEAYNVTDDSIYSHGEFMQMLALLCGRRLRKIPLVTMSMLQPLAVWSAKKVRNLEVKHKRYKRLRIWEESSARYVSSSYWISNQKIKSLGYQFEYPDLKMGLKDTIQWMIEMGWIQ